MTRPERTRQDSLGACLIHSRLLYREVIGLFMMGVTNLWLLWVLATALASVISSDSHQLKHLAEIRAVTSAERQVTSGSNIGLGQSLLESLQAF